MTSPHQVSISVFRNDRSPIAAVFGTGTSIVRTAGYSTTFGFRRPHLPELAARPPFTSRMASSIEVVRPLS